MSWVKSYTMSPDLEERFFKVALLITLPYFLSSIVFDLMSMKNMIFLIIDSTFLLACIGMILLSRKEAYRSFLINLFSLLVLVGFVFYWMNSNGLEGGGPYIFPVISVLIILINKGLSTVIYSIFLVIIGIILPSSLLPIAGGVSYEGLLFDFLLNLIILSILLFFFKRALDVERTELEKKNQSIIKLNAELDLKTTEMELYNRDIQSIKKNLELVAERYSETVEKENEKIIEYSFINAHLVRAPLTNIIGLSELAPDNEGRLASLRASARDLDRVLHKISDTLHS